VKLEAAAPVMTAADIKKALPLRRRMALFGVIVAIIVAAASAVFCWQPAFALTIPLPTTETTVSELVNAGQEYDGDFVVFQGEAIGDIIDADEGMCWLAVEDEGDSISVYCSRVEAERITWLGRYGQVGDIVKVSGFFDVSCEQHQGLSDVHSTQITVLEVGHATPEPYDLRAFEVGGVLVVLGILLLLLYWYLRERER
jgi:hypothetical protein